MILEHWSKKFEMTHISNDNQFAEHLINKKNNWLTWRKLKKNIQRKRRKIEEKGEKIDRTQLQVCWLNI